MNYQNQGYQGYQGAPAYQGAQGAQGGNAMDYTVDMVFCIDATGSMEDTSGSQMKIINMVKRNALNFYADFNRKMSEKSKQVRQLRVRIVAFRDYLADSENAMLVTDFFLLPSRPQSLRPASTASPPRAAAISPRTAWKHWPTPSSPSGPPKAPRSVRSSWSGPTPPPMIWVTAPAPPTIPTVCPEACPSSTTGGMS